MTRKRLLIALVAVLALSAVWWLTRPLIDPRLVGTWSVQTNVGPLYHRLVFHANGTGAVEQPAGATPWPIEWGIDRGELWWMPVGRTTLRNIYRRFERGRLSRKKEDAVFWKPMEWTGDVPYFRHGKLVVHLVRIPDWPMSVDADET
jgi:hypothetical protein